MNTTTHDYVTHTEFQIEIKNIRNDIKDLKNEMQNMDTKISRQVTESFWKMAPMMVTIQLAMTGIAATAFFILARISLKL